MSTSKEQDLSKMQKIIAFTEKLLMNISILVFILMLLAVLVQVVARNLLPTAPGWTEEATRYLLIYIVAVAIGPAAMRRELVNVDILLNLFKPSIRRYLFGLIDLIVLVFFAIFSYYIYQYMIISNMQTATTIPLQMSFIAFSILLLSFNMILFMVFNLWKDFFGPPPSQSTIKDLIHTNQ